ncbi:MAG: GNAT family N-acetyltransferase, partial [Rhodanobacter sp.]
MSIQIARAQSSQVDALCAIEREAVKLFRGHPVWASYAAMAIPPELLQQAVSRGLVWVGLSTEGAPLGFVWLDIAAGGNVIGIAEMNVLPEHGRRGIGAALLEHACGWAREAGYRRVDLGTLADVRWNAPFYAKHGFAVVDKDAPAFAYARQRDRDNGFPDALRVFMSRPLSAPARDEWTVWPAPAKLNLFLRITGRRTDGYHELQTVFRLLDWGDEVRLRVRADGVIRRLQGAQGVQESADLVVRAAQLLQRHAGSTAGVDIAVTKRIPMG